MQKYLAHSLFMDLHLLLPLMLRLLVELPGLVSDVFRTEILLVGRNNAADTEQCNVYVRAICGVK